MAAPAPTATATALATSADRESEELGRIGLISVGSGGDPNAPTAPWGRDDALSPNGLSGLGLLGSGDAGISGQGSGSGHGRLSGSGSTRVPFLLEGATTVTGRLSSEVICRVVRPNFGRLRLCYENALRTNARLTGTVKTKFVIEATGSVSSAVDEGSDIGDAKMIACVVHVFTALPFPEPEGKGTVTVIYPVKFVLRN